VILTDQKGLYTADPRKNPDAQFVHQAQAGDLALEQMAGGVGSMIGSGGMITKILAAKRAAVGEAAFLARGARMAARQDGNDDLKPTFSPTATAAS